jgi:hypothetical protein
MATLALARSLAVLLLLVPQASAFGENLGKRYRATMTWSGSGLPWTSGPEDVWRLKSFAFEHRKDLDVSCGPATVVFGVHETNALWAVVFPDEPGEIDAKLFPGHGEAVDSIMLRFAPDAVGKLFPKATVKDNGDPWLRFEADRIARRKIGWKWFTPAGYPTIVQSGWTMVDVETTEGGRRFYGVDGNGGGVEYVGEFAGKPVPPLPAIDEVTASAAFDEVWQTFDREYAGFGLVDVDWETLREQYRPAAAQAPTVFRLGAILSDMLARLEDLHVAVKAGDDWLPGHQRSRPLNASWKGSLAQLETTRSLGNELTFGLTDDGLGYLAITGLSNGGLPQQADEALEVLGETWGLVLDLRFNGGGDERLAMDVAGRFLETEQVYSTNRYRSGPGHDELGEVLERRVAPRGPWRYGGPVMVLQGQRTLSSAESFVLMLATSDAITTLGDRTGGSSGNPRLLELECGISVKLPRWLDMDPEGNPIEHVGIAPQVQVKTKTDAFTDEDDAVMEAALKRLRKTPRSRREPARG